MFHGRLTNLLLWMAEQGAFEPVWSDQIHAEWMRNLAASNLQIPQARIDWCRAEMERAFPAANCPPDPALARAVQTMCRANAQRKDAHVVATAVKAGTSIIVTHNTEDFAPAMIQHHGLAKIRPDAFCVDLLANWPTEILAGLREHRNSLMRTAIDPAQYVNWLAMSDLRLPRFSQRLQAHVALV